MLYTEKSLLRYKVPFFCRSGHMHLKKSSISFSSAMYIIILSLVALAKPFYDINLIISRYIVYQDNGKLP